MSYPVSKRINIMMKKIILIILGVLAYSTLFSQEPSRHEISVWGMGGLSTLKYDLEIGSQKDKLGGGAGIGYTYYISDVVGISSGFEFALYNSKATLNSAMTSYLTKDMENTDFLFKSTVSNYEETQKSTYLNIPIMLSLQFPVKDNNKFYTSAGVKVGIPLSSNYKAKKGDVKNTGYYDFEDFEYQNVEELGFTTLQPKDSDGDYDLNIACILSLEAGMKWELKDNLSLYTGFYFDYGLNDIGKDERTKQFIEYTPTDPRNFVNNSILASKYVADDYSNSFTDKVVPMALGLKIKLAFRLSK